MIESLKPASFSIRSSSSCSRIIYRTGSNPIISSGLASLTPTTLPPTALAYSAPPVTAAVALIVLITRLSRITLTEKNRLVAYLLIYYLLLSFWFISLSDDDCRRIEGSFTLVTTLLSSGSSRYSSGSVLLLLLLHLFFSDPLFFFFF